jgi:hypothetical protein
LARRHRQHHKQYNSSCYVHSRLMSVGRSCRCT